MGGSQKASTPQPPSPHGAYLTFPPHAGNIGGSHQSITHNQLSHYPHATGSAFQANNDAGDIGHQHDLPPPSPCISVNSMASMASTFAAMHSGLPYSPHARNKRAFKTFGGG